VISLLSSVSTTLLITLLSSLYKRTTSFISLSIKCEINTIDVEFEEKNQYIYFRTDDLKQCDFDFNISSLLRFIVVFALGKFILTFTNL
jgi:hypothetical protein